MIHESGSNLSSKQKGALRSCANGEFLNEGGAGGGQGSHKQKQGVFQARKVPLGKGQGSIKQITSSALIRKCHIDWLKGLTPGRD